LTHHCNVQTNRRMRCLSATTTRRPAKSPLNTTAFAN